MNCLKIGTFEVNAIYNIDAFEAFKQIPDKSIPYMFTSPPFKDKDVNENYWTFYDRFMSEVNRIISEYALIFNSSTKMYDIYVRYGRPYRTLFWIKGYIRYSYRWEPIFVYKFTDSWNITSTIWSDLLLVSPLLSKDPEKIHPYQDPLKLYIWIIKMLKGENKLILDPFIGVGTTGAACKRLKRPFLGFEIDKSIYEKAVTNLKRSTLW